MEGVNKLTDGKKENTQTGRETDGNKEGSEQQAEAGRQEVDGG